MATTIKIRGDANSGEEVVLVGRALRPLTRITSLIRSRVIREVTLPIGEVVEQPELVFTGDLVAPTQLQQSQSVQLSANLFSQVEGGPLTLVEDYDPTHWTKAITSGGSSASLGGANGDLLTATTTLGDVVVSFTYNVSGHEAFGTVATATVEVVASPTFNVALTGLPANVVQGNTYILGAERRDGVTDQIVDNNPANFTFTITSGASFASITNGNQLNINPSTAGNSVTVRATHNVGGEQGNATTNIIAPPTFPAVLQPASGHTVLANFNGSTKDWSPQGWTFGGEWADNDRVEVVADGLAKFGNAIEKRFFAGEEYGGWKGLTTKNIGLWTELYVRLVFMLAPNWAWHPGGGKYVYIRNAGTGNARRNFILGSNTGSISGLSSGPGRRIGAWDFSSGQRQVYPTIPEANLSRGVYHTVEYLIGADIGNTGGYLRMAVDGIITATYAGLGMPSDTTLSDIDWLYSNAAGLTDQRIGAATEAFMFNGGDGGIVPANTFIRLSEFYISGRN